MSVCSKYVQKKFNFFTGKIKYFFKFFEIYVKCNRIFLSFCIYMYTSKNLKKYFEIKLTLFLIKTSGSELGKIQKKVNYVMIV